MKAAKLIALTSFTMIGFASNSLICRWAFTHTDIDAASFTTIRIISGALMLNLISLFKTAPNKKSGSWLSAFALILYAAGFSFAYMSLSASTGALLLFGTVQVTMISHGLLSGERLAKIQYLGLVIAFGGLVGLLLPGLSAPPLGGSLLMIGAGIGWGIYSLRGRWADDAVTITAGNFLRATPMALILSLLMLPEMILDTAGIWFAIASGAMATGIVYVIWYSVLPVLQDTSAAIVQLSVPIIAALGGITLLGEPATIRYILSTAATLGGILLAIRRTRCDGLRAGPC